MKECHRKDEALTRVLCVHARVAELADALDLGSSGQPWGFESPLSHQQGKAGGRHRRRKEVVARVFLSGLKDHEG